MAQPKLILVVDGDPQWRERVMEALASPRVSLSGFSEGAEALEFARREKPSLVVTEFALPGLSGLGLTRLLREDPALETVGVVMVTEYSSEIDRVIAFEAGVDDLLPKPFFARELHSRVGAVLRRSEPGRGTDAFVPTPRGLVTLHPTSAFAAVRDRRLDLTPREFHLLASLVRHGGHVVSRRQLITEVWGPDSEQTDRVVDAHIKAIRRKLGVAKDCLETVRGVGYRFSDVVTTHD